MADDERVAQDGGPDADLARLPIPLGDRRPAVRPSDEVALMALAESAQMCSAKVLSGGRVEAASS
jgi:hypothetical protein